jgi:hypothetical protein
MKIKSIIWLLLLTAFFCLNLKAQTEISNDTPINWLKTTPAACNANLKTQFFVVNFTTGELLKCSGGSYTGLGGSSSIGGSISGGTAGSLLFVNGSGQFAQSNAKLFWNTTLGTLKLQDKNYLSFAGVLDVEPLFSNSSNDNVQNNLGAITTSSHFVGMANDLKIDASGANKLYTGFFNQLRVGGAAYSGTPTIRGIWNQVNNRQNLTAVPNIYGIDSAVSVEGHATEAVGGQIYVFKGSAVNALKLVGVRAIALNAYTNADSVTAIDADTRQGNPSFAPTVTLMRSVWAHTTQVVGTITTLNGIEVSGWSQTGGSVGTTSAIKIDNSTQIGATNYAIQSLSTAPSVFTGSVTVPADAYSSSWNGNNEAPTKNDVYDKVEASTTVDGNRFGRFRLPAFLELRHPAKTHRRCGERQQRRLHRACWLPVSGAKLLRMGKRRRLFRLSRG